VCAGAKAILDLPKTVEQLETFGVPVIGYRTDEFPAFYSRASGLRVDITADKPDDVSEIALSHWQSGGVTGVLLCAPVPEEFEIPIEDVERAVSEAVKMAERRKIRGKALTPFLLQQVKEITGGDTLNSNRALLVNNCGIAAQVAASLQKMTQD
jgi:pseudouridine-5'-phosphate glycosidase